MTPHPLSLEPMTLMDVGARETVDIAAQLGCEYVSMVLHEPVPALPCDPIVADLTLRRETAQAMRATGVKLSNIECFNLTPAIQPSDLAAGLECGHELGARTATAILSPNDDRADALAKYQRLCDMAAELNIRVNVEFFMSSRSMTTLPDAIAFARDSGRANAGVTIDVLHLFRTGSSVANLKAMDPDLIGAVQLSDGPSTIDHEGHVIEAGKERLAPGAGAFPLRAVLELIPPSVIVGIEVPQSSLIGKVAPEERARALLEATRNLYRN